MHDPSRLSAAGRVRRSAPLDPTSVRILLASAVGVVILVIWLTGTLGDSHRVTLLSLSAVSILGLGLVLELRRRFDAEAALLRAKEEAEATSRGKSQFLATMSHELRTPLNGIMGFAEVMKSEVMGPMGNDRYRSYAADIHESGAHLLQLINDILDLAKAEAGKLDLEEEIVDVAEIVHSVVRVSRGSIAHGGLDIELDLAPGLRLKADERRLRQILFNLIGNAIKFTEKGGIITVTAGQETDGSVRVTVADTGIGIAASDLKRVLEPFVQIQSEIGRRHAGTGLGLPAVRAMMELHGGDLELKSRVGVGTQAIVTFPKHRTAAPSPNVSDSPATAETSKPAGLPVRG